MKKFLFLLVTAFAVLIPTTAQAVETSDATANTVPISNTRFWNGTGYGGGGICIENRTEWTTWYDRLSTASSEMSRAADWYSNVGNGVGTCASRPSQYQIHVYRYSDSSRPCWSIDADAAWSSQGWYYYTKQVTLWLNTASPDCGIVPANVGKQANAVSTALLSIAALDYYHGGSEYSVMNLDRSDIIWPTANDRAGIDRRY